jgi:hypothetical protein
MCDVDDTGRLVELDVADQQAVVLVEGAHVGRCGTAGLRRRHGSRGPDTLRTFSRRRQSWTWPVAMSPISLASWSGSRGRFLRVVVM